jgi:F0F1-type ATP synthase assembly protein I
MMLRRVRSGLAAAALLLGCGHLAIAAIAISQGRWGLDALWFTSGGLAIVMPALLNMVALRAPAGDLPARALAVFASAVTAGFFAVGYTVLPEPQVIVGMVLFAGLAAGALLPEARRA